MLKLSLLVGLFLPVATTVLESPVTSSLSSDKKIKVQEIFTLIETIQNGLQNNRRIPVQPPSSFPIPIQIQT